MARVTYSALVGSVRGSIGGVTFKGGGVGGVVSSRAVVRRSTSSAQERQRAIVSEARRSYESLTVEDRHAYEFAVGEGYQLRPAVGARFSSARAAYVAWYSAIRWTGGLPEAAADAALLRRYGGAKDVKATCALYPSLSFKFYTDEAYVGSPYALWFAPAKRVGEIPPRPIWKLIYSAGFDPILYQTNSGLPAPWNLCTEFAPYVAARCSYFTAGRVIAYRWNGPTDGGGVGPSSIQTMMVI